MQERTWRSRTQDGREWRLKFGYVLSYHMNGKGYKDQDLADILEVGRTTVGKWRRGDMMPSLENLVKLTYIFGVPIEEFVDFGYIRDL